MKTIPDYVRNTDLFKTRAGRNMEVKASNKSVSEIARVADESSGAGQFALVKGVVFSLQGYNAAVYTSKESFGRIPANKDFDVIEMDLNISKKGDKEVDENIVSSTGKLFQSFPTEERVGEMTFVSDDAKDKLLNFIKTYKDHKGPRFDFMEGRETFLKNFHEYCHGKNVIVKDTITYKHIEKYRNSDETFTMTTSLYIFEQV